MWRARDEHDRDGSGGVREAAKSEHDSGEDVIGLVEFATEFLRRGLGRGLGAGRRLGGGGLAVRGAARGPVLGRAAKEGRAGFRARDETARKADIGA